MGFLSRKKKKEEKSSWIENKAFDTQKDEEGTMESPIYEGSTTTSAKLPLSELYGELYTSKKSGFFKKNSDEYNGVSDALVNTLDKLASPLSKDNRAAIKTAVAVKNSFQNLIKKCDRYLDRKDSRFMDLHGRSKKGSARQDIVSRIRTQAMDDFQKLTVYFGEFQVLPDSEKASSVWEALGSVRRRKLHMKQKDSEYKHVGGVMSRLTELKDKDLEETDTSGFFKETEFLKELSSKRTTLFDTMARCNDLCHPPESFYKRSITYMKEHLPDDDSEINYLACADLLKQMSGADSPEAYEYVKAVSSYIIGIQNSLAIGKRTLNWDLSNGKSINLTNRNVATSRVAELLGVGDVVAKSETVEMFEHGNETSRTGNLMQKAAGTEANTYLKRHADTINESSLSSDVATARKEHGLAQKISGNFQRQMINLQVLDYITGQIDRNHGNYFLQEDENGMLTGVTGIDNDLSFGDYNPDDYGAIDKHGRSIVNKKGDKFLIPYMDANMAERIKNINKDQLSFLLGDLLDEKSIDQACERLAKVQKLLKEKEADPNDHFLLQDNEWNQETLKKFFTEERDATFGGTSYLQRLFAVENFKTSENNLSSYQTTRMRNNQWLHFLRENALDSSEKIANFLISILPSELSTRDYMKGELLSKGQRGELSPDIPLDELPISNPISVEIEHFLQTLPE